MVVGIVDVGNGGCPFYVAASEIANCAGGWMSQCPRPRSHDCCPSQRSGAIDPYHQLDLPCLLDCWARLVFQVAWQIELSSLCYVST